MTLYELTGEMAALLAMLEDGEADEDVIQDTMEAVGLEFEEKADGYAKMIRAMQGDVEVIKAERERLARREETISNAIKRMKERLEESMRATGKTKFKTALFGYSIQKNPATVNITGDVPERFYIQQEPKLDKRALIAYVKEHGDQEYAELTQTESLRIR